MEIEDFNKLTVDQKEEFFDYIHKQKYEGKNFHNEPAGETKLRLQALELTQKNLMDKLEENQITNEKAHEAIMVSMKEFHLTTNESLRDMTEKLDKALAKKADKWTEFVLRYLGIAIGSGILGYIGLQLVKVIEKL